MPEFLVFVRVPPVSPPPTTGKRKTGEPTPPQIFPAVLIDAGDEQAAAEQVLASHVFQRVDNVSALPVDSEQKFAVNHSYTTEAAG